MHPPLPNGTLINDLGVSQFRCFEDLRIDHVGRVNLIVGRNNVGKSSLLEALRLYATAAAPQVLWELLVARDEHRRITSEEVGPSGSDAPALLSLFYGRKSASDITQPIRIGPERQKLEISLEWFHEVMDSEVGRRLEPAQSSLFEMSPDLVPALAIRLGDISRRLRLDRSFDIYRRRYYVRPDSSPESSEPCVFVGSGALNAGHLARMWDRIVLGDLEAEVTSALAIMTPRIERISFVEGGHERERTPRAKVTGVGQPVPLKSLGEGVNRLFGMVLALVNAKDGMLLVDEIENGIHHTIQGDLWRLMIALAERLNVQVFATTHSTDCVKAFQRATRDRNDVVGVLTRLEFSNGSVQASQFDEEELTIATREGIEVR
jgi:Predicted ATPase